MAVTKPLVSVGVPVFNGEDHLEAALGALAAQDYPNLEIVIGDNASTDATESICRRFAVRNRNVQYLRHADNLGPAENFRQVLLHATGELFMWAAHDDLRNPRFVSALVEAILNRPEAVLATPKTIYISDDGSPSPHDNDRPAGDRSTLGNLYVYYRDNAASWIYGLYRRDWLVEHAHEWPSYPVWGGDVMWTVSIILRRVVTGSADAIIYKRYRRSGYAPKNEVERLRFAITILKQLTQNSLRYASSWRVGLVALLMGWAYCYRRYVRRGNPLKTLARIARLPGIALNMLAESRARRGVSQDECKFSPEVAIPTRSHRAA